MGKVDTEELQGDSQDHVITAQELLHNEPRDLSTSRALDTSVLKSNPSIPHPSPLTTHDGSTLLLAFVLFPTGTHASACACHPEEIASGLPPGGVARVGQCSKEVLILRKRKHRQNGYLAKCHPPISWGHCQSQIPLPVKVGLCGFEPETLIWAVELYGFEPGTFIWAVGLCGFEPGTFIWALTRPGAWQLTRLSGTSTQRI